jgi:hypothetical protein
VASGAQWGGAWSAKEGKWRWKIGAVDEGEHLGAFYRVQEGGEVVLGERRRWQVSMGDNGLQGFSFGRGTEEVALGAGGGGEEVERRFIPE